MAHGETTQCCGGGTRDCTGQRAWVGGTGRCFLAYNAPRLVCTGLTPLAGPWFSHAGVQAFAGSAQLKVHRAIHTGVKLFNCPVEGCDKKFSDRSGLRYHKKAAHSGERPYQCNIDGCGTLSIVGATGAVPLWVRRWALPSAVCPCSGGCLEICNFKMTTCVVWRGNQ